MKVSGLELEVERRGRGRPLLVLYGEEALERDAPVLAELAKDYELIIPSPPGFGTSERPDWIEFLTISPTSISIWSRPWACGRRPRWVLIRRLARAGNGHEHDGFCSKLVLAAPYGVKIGGPADRDIQDPWNIHPSKAAELKWFDPEKGKRDFGAMPERELTVVARNNELFARFCWDPCLHNPKLKQRLHRVRVPTLFVWGEHDGIVTPDYGKAFSRMISQARFAIVEQAGHYPHLEQPAKFLTLVQDFLS